MPATTYFEGLILEYAVNGTPFVITNWYLALYSADPPTPATEITSASWPRQEVLWTATAPYTNTNLLTFSTYPGADIDGNSIGVCDTLTNGQLLVWNSADLGTIVSGQTKTLGIGLLTLDILNV